MYKNSRSTVLLPLVVAAAVALGIFLGQFLGRSSAESDIKGILRSLALPQNKVSQTLSLIETQYVDSVAIDSLVERALPVIVSELDPHSVYIPASEMAEINEPLDGEFDGIGVVFNMATDTVIVLNVIPSGPSDKAGVVAGDRIVRINDMPVEFSGEYNALIVVQQDKPGVVAHITSVLSRHGVNIAFMRLFREGKGDIAYTIVESDGRLPENVSDELRENGNVHEVMIVQP